MHPSPPKVWAKADPDRTFVKLFARVPENPRRFAGHFREHLAVDF